jgi:hypothetical protein
VQFAICVRHDNRSSPAGLQIFFCIAFGQKLSLSPWKFRSFALGKKQKIGYKTAMIK